jgi:plasmid stabilization system protein ParE
VKPRYSVEYLPAAEQDLVDILDYIARDDPAAGRNFVDRIDQTIGRLSFFPNSGQRPREDRLRRRGYRVLVVGDYLVFYVIVSRRVEVRRVIHGARRYDFLFDPGD